MRRGRLAFGDPLVETPGVGPQGQRVAPGFVASHRRHQTTGNDDEHDGVNPWVCGGPEPNEGFPTERHEHQETGGREIQIPLRERVLAKGGEVECGNERDQEQRRAIKNAGFESHRVRQHRKGSAEPATRQDAWIAKCLREVDRVRVAGASPPRAFQRKAR